MDSTNNRFFITGVQLEEGTVATSFEHRLYQEELALCQRYYVKVPANSYSYLPTATDTGTGTGGSSHSRVHLMWPVTMRTAPTVSSSNYNLNGTTHGVNGYQSSGAIDVMYEITGQAEL